MMINNKILGVLKGKNVVLNKRPIVVGSGPAGLFCAYLLALMGYNPLIIERGEKVEDRFEKIYKSKIYTGICVYDSFICDVR